LGGSRKYVLPLLYTLYYCFIHYTMRLRIKEILNEKGWTKSDLAKALGQSRQSVDYFLKSSSITLKSLEKLSAALDVPAWTLLASKDDITRYLLANEDKEALSPFFCPSCGRRFKAELVVSLDIPNALAKYKKSKKTVARLLGLTPSAFDKVLSSPTPPAATILQRIANAVGCELSDLFSATGWTATPMP